MQLASFERRWLATIFETVLPTRDDPRFDLSADDIDRYIVDLMARAPGHFTLGLRACTWIVQLCPPIVLGRLRTFTGLQPAQRAEVLERFGRARHPLAGELPLLFKMSACLGVCGLPDVQRRIGIAPTDNTPPTWAAHRRRSLPPLPILPNLPTEQAGDGAEIES